MPRGSGGADAERNSRPPRRLLGVNGKTNVFSSLFSKIAFPCSVALKSFGASSAPPRSRPMFSNIFGFVVFIVLHLWRSRALFSDSLWPSVTFLEVVFFRLGALELYFPVCGALLLSLLGVALSCLLTGRVRSGAQSARRHLGAGRFMMAAKKRQKAYKNNGFEHF